MKPKEVVAIKGVIGAGIFDTNGKLISYSSKTLSSEQADSTAMLCGTIYSLIESIASLYSRFCGIKMHPVTRIDVISMDFGISLTCSSRGCTGIIFNQNELERSKLDELLQGMVEEIE
jgi:roadblock/LC7 domain-containing protein